MVKEKNISGEKERLDIMLKADIDGIHAQIAKCQAVVDEFKNKGLQGKEELEMEMTKENAANSKDLSRALRAMKNTNEPYLNREYIFRNYEVLRQVEEDSYGVHDMIERLHRR